MTGVPVVHEFASFGRWHGQVNDLDSHLETPFFRWGELLGESWGRAAEAFSPTGEYDSQRSTRFEAAEFWEVKHAGAPGMFDLSDRLRILDIVGIRRQLVFPALMMMSKLWSDAAGRAERLRCYNEFAGRWTAESGGRVRVAATVAGGLEEVLSQAEAALAAGARALLIQDGTTIERCSPADPQMDPLWAMLAQANACALLHIGGSDAFMSNDWKLTDALNVDPASSNLGDRLAGPHNIGTMHLSPCNYVTCLVFGGVFDRHPALRFGVIEYGAMWAAPLLDLLTNRRSQSARAAGLQRTPREVFSENLRFTPFGFEPIARQIERYGLPEMYGFSTDFPHPEGGHNPHELLHTDLAPLGTRTIEQFFVSNADLLVPD